MNEEQKKELGELIVLANKFKEIEKTGSKSEEEVIHKQIEEKFFSCYGKNSI